MHSVWYFFIERRQFTFLVTLSLIIAGVASVILIPKESAPEVEIPVAVVSTTLRGASAEDVAELVTKELEKEIASVDNISKLSSASREGISIISAEFEASADLKTSIEDVKDAVERAKNSLPRDADDPFVSQVNFSDQPVMIVSLSGGIPAAEFSKIGDEIADELEEIRGVSRVEVSGDRSREIEVVVRRQALSSYGLSISDVIAAIQQSSASLPLGDIRVSDIQYAVRYIADLKSPDDLATVTVGLLGGRPVYLTDVADIVNGIERERSISRVSVEGAPAEPAITLSVFKKSGGNIITATRDVEMRLDELTREKYVGITPLIIFSAGEEILRDLSELSRVGLETVILVMLCLFVTIGWRESVVAGLSIPLSFVIAFIGLYISGNTINFVSLFSLILAIGILVDSGIVVTEAIHTRLKRFGDPIVAAKESIREYAWPLIAGTMTTVAVFAPLFFISGIVGEFISSIPFTIISLLIASIFVALGLVPLIAIRFTKREMNRLEEAQEKWNAKVQEWYRVWLRNALSDSVFQRRFLRGTALLFVLALSLPVTGIVKSEFFPGDDIDLIFIEIEQKQGTPLEITNLSALAIEEYLYDDEVIESFTTTVGGTSAFTGGSLGATTEGGKFANITLNLVSKDERDESSSEIAERYRRAFADFNTFTVRIYEQENGPPSGAPILVTFAGDDLDQLERIADRAERTLAGISGTTEIVSSTKDNGLEFALSVDRAKAAEVGVSPAQIAQVLRSAVSGTIATTMNDANTDIDVLVSADLNANWRDTNELNEANIDTILNIPIRTLRGEVLLGSLVSASLERSKAVINREDRETIASVSSYLNPGYVATEVSSEFERQMKESGIPEGITMKVGGETEDVDQSFQDMFIALIAGMVFMLAILVLEFNSFRYSFYLLMLVPLSLIGVLAGLALTGKPLSFPSLLGIVALAGVIINHAIILVDSIIVRMRHPEGRTLSEVVVDAATSRLRPIFLTTVTTVVGMIPLASASGLWGPLAFTIMFGLAFAMILTLVLTPILVYRHPGKQFWSESTR